jgi:hypothetical protein
MIPYAHLDPLSDYQPISGTDAALASLNGPVAGWPLPLGCYLIGHRPVDEALVLPIGLIAEEQWFSDSIQYLPPHWCDTPWSHSFGGFDLSRDGDRLGLLRRESRPELLLPGS